MDARALASSERSLRKDRTRFGTVCSWSDSVQSKSELPGAILQAIKGFKSIKQRGMASEEPGGKVGFLRVR